MTAHHEDPEAHHYDTQRLEAFRDGVFAIAITLLIIEIGVPQVDADGSLTDALLDLWASYFGYAVSFLTIGVMWVNHHHMFKDIVRADHTLLVLNLLLLLGVAFVPFPTAVVAEFVGEKHHELEATLAYGGTFVVIAIFFDALWLYVTRRDGMIDEHVSEARIRSRTRRYLPGPLYYAVPLPLAFVNPWIPLSIYAALALFWFLPYGGYRDWQPLAPSSARGTALRSTPPSQSLGCCPSTNEGTPSRVVTKTSHRDTANSWRMRPIIRYDWYVQCR